MKIELANPKIITWARERAGFDIDQLAAKVNISPDQLGQIEQGQKVPSKGQLDRIAAKTYVPVDFLFFDEPPYEALPMTDFRTRSNTRPKKISANLWDSIHDAQRKRGWYRDYLIRNEAPRLPFIGMHKKNDRVEDIAKSMRKYLSIDEKPNIKNKEQHLTYMAERVEQARILIIRNGGVCHNKHRTLDPQEFRGFALCDEYAPVIFINNNDHQAAQIFTLAHELAHLFLGKGGLYDPMEISDLGDEILCNRIAAELLVPRTDFMRSWKQSPQHDRIKIEELTKVHKVSRAVIARCALSYACIKRDFYWQWWQEETRRFEELKQRKEESSGGDSSQQLQLWPEETQQLEKLKQRKEESDSGDYKSMRWRNGGKEFSLALGRSVQGMETSYKEALRLLNMNNSNTIKRYMKTLGLNL